LYAVRTADLESTVDNAGRPTLVVVSGPAGAGKTTLAHALARALGCPAICRDEIKQGMVHAAGGFGPGTGAFVAAPGDELTMRTLPAFFGVLELLLRAGVTTVAEAAFQDRVWRPRLEAFRGLARVRVVHCLVNVDVAWARFVRRREEDPLRQAHADDFEVVEHVSRHTRFERVSLDVPTLEVDTTDGYRPALGNIVAFVNGPD
jgi:predicted kinase